MAAVCGQALSWRNNAPFDSFPTVGDQCLLHFGKGRVSQLAVIVALFSK